MSAHDSAAVSTPSLGEGGGAPKVLGVGPVSASGISGKSSSRDGRRNWQTNGAHAALSNAARTDCIGD